jgi:hypothetical protein
VLSKLKSLPLAAAVLLSLAAGAAAQTVELRQWHGPTAVTRQSEQVLATTMAEWRSLWSRVGANAPDMFEPGRMNAIGIFLGLRPGPYSVNVLSASRRRDRIMVVFEERGPATDVMVAQHPPSMAPQARALSGGPSFGAPTAGFAPPGTGMAPPPPPSPVGRPPMGPPTSPWAIVLINRTDLPITVEQRLFR